MTETDPSDVLSFGHATETRDTSNDHIAFNLEEDGPVYHARRPKMKVLLDLAGAVEDDSNPLRQASAYLDLLGEVLEPESADAIRARWDDPDDDLDIDSGSIGFMFQTLTGMWYGNRPTGGRAGSSGSPARTGKRSTVRSRAKA